MNARAESHPVSGPYTPRGDRAHVDRRVGHRERPAGPFVPERAPRADPTASELRSAVRAGARRRGRRRAALDARRPDVGYEEWGAGAAVRPNAVALAAAAPSHADPAPVVAEDLDARLRASAADRLESVARRVRSGDLRPLGLSAAMTEAGALAATLAAILTPAP